MLNITQSRRYKWSVGLCLTVVSIWICTWPFYPQFWWLLLLPYLMLIIIFFIELAGSIIFLIKNQKKYDQPYLPLIINIIAFVVILCWPSVNTNKRYPQYSYNLCTRASSHCDCNLDLYEEYYLALSGFQSSDLIAVYLTDKKNFRLYLGVYREGEQINVKLDGDYITIVKTTTESIDTLWNKERVMQKQKFSLIDLKRKHIFQ